MARLITDAEWLGSAAGVTAKPYGNDPDWDDLWTAYALDTKNNPGPSVFLREQGHFKIGDVIQTPAGLVRIINIHRHRTGHFGFLIPKYRVQPITKKGQWSKVWHYTYPGLVQRAYAKAGDPLAVAQIARGK